MSTHSPNGLASPDKENIAFWAAGAIALVLTLTGTSLFVDAMLITFLHESSHGIAAILTGGSLVEFTMQPDGSGLAHTMGGFRWFVLMAGYMGGCAWGGAMLVAARAKGLARPVLFTLSGFMLLFTLIYVRNLFGFAAGLGWAAFFGAAAWYGRGIQLSFLLSFLAWRNSINAFEDLRELLSISVHSTTVTDAQLMSTELTFGMVPSIVFALLIGLMSLVIFGGFAWFAFKPRRASV